MKIKAKVAFFTDNYDCVGFGEIVDINDKLAKKLIDYGYASFVEIDDIKDEAPKKKASTRKKKVEVE